MEYTAYNPARYLPTPEQASAQGARIIKAIERYGACNDRSQSILEIGCGPGNLLFELKRRGFASVRGIDLDPTMAAHGRGVLGNVIDVADWLSYLRSTADRFDVIVALDVFEHVAPEQAADVLRATRDCLNPGGRLILRVPNPDCPFVLPTYCGDLTHRLLVTRELLSHLLRAAGFSGEIRFGETEPERSWKRLVYLAVHWALVRPLTVAMYYHFYGRKPGPITRNMYCAAVAGQPGAAGI